MAYNKNIGHFQYQHEDFVENKDFIFIIAMAIIRKSMM